MNRMNFTNYPTTYQLQEMPEREISKIENEVYSM